MHITYWPHENCIHGTMTLYQVLAIKVSATKDTVYNVDDYRCCVLSCLVA